MRQSCAFREAAAMPRRWRAIWRPTSFRRPLKRPLARAGEGCLATGPSLVGLLDDGKTPAGVLGEAKRRPVVLAGWLCRVRRTGRAHLGPRDPPCEKLKTNSAAQWLLSAWHQPAQSSGRPAVATLSLWRCSSRLLSAPRVRCATTCAPRARTASLRSTGGLSWTGCTL